MFPVVGFSGFLENYGMVYLITYSANDFDVIRA